MSNTIAPIRITILGSTGSIGRSALEVVRNYPDRFEIHALAAHSNIDLLARQIAEFKPACVAVTDETAGARLHAMDTGVPVRIGPDGLEEIASSKVDIVLCAVVGAVGLRPLLAAIQAGNRVAVANKEPFVMAGRLVMETARNHQIQVLPVDSEHNAIFQCLHGHHTRDVRCIYLTASGGPFYGRSRASLTEVSPEEAARHPRWDMGAKISVDSATLMNKGLEIIEAMWLFGMDESKIDVIIHPQSIVHSLVEFNDGNILAQLSVTDMKFPILYALTWPERVDSPIGRLRLSEVGALTFEAPDFSQFPCLQYARRAAAQGGTAPAVLNAANEAAVAAFLARRIPFLQISDVVRDVCEACPVNDEYSLSAVLDADRMARSIAEERIARQGAGIT